MSSVPVEAAWCIPITKANYRAAYGRVSHGEFTKDYFQIPGGAYDATVRLLMNGDDTVNAHIEYIWPGGSVKDEVRKSSSERRLRMSWPYGNAPKPWKPTLYPSESTPETLPGDPAVFTQELDPDSAAATVNSQWDDADNAGIHAWALAVKLKGQEGILHARMYLVDPPAGYEWASIQLLPPVLEQLIRNGNASAIVHVFEWPVRAHRLVREILAALENGPNVLMTGPPGTGKTVALEDLRSIFEGQLDLWEFDPTKNHDAWSRGRQSSGGSTKVVSLVFHPGYAYENFVLGVFPSAVKEGAIEVVPGPLLELGHFAEAADHEGLLIIDEFNRGRAAAIFGDTLTLLDEDKRSNLTDGTRGSQITRRYTRQEARVSAEFRVSPTDDGKLPDQLSLPRSLKIIAAMNSSDRSVATLDSAMRRRFSIVEVGPDYDVLAAHYGIDATLPLPAAPSGPDDVKLLAHGLLKGLNRRIRAVAGADFELGQALVWRVSGVDLASALNSLAHAVDQRVVATLRMTFRDETDILGAVLRAPETSGPAANSTLFASWVDAPSEVEQFAARSLHITPLLAADPGDLWGLLLPLVQ
jgi:5-methylcytosine-specific restriction enzyme B